MFTVLALVVLGFLAKWTYDSRNWRGKEAQLFTDTLITTSFVQLKRVKEAPEGGLSASFHCSYTKKPGKFLIGNLGAPYALPHKVLVDNKTFPVTQFDYNGTLFIPINSDVGRVMMLADKVQIVFGEPVPRLVGLPSMRNLRRVLKDWPAHCSDPTLLD